MNSEGIRAPDCFEVERICRDRIATPVFRDDQHGTAIVAAAAATNALRVAVQSCEDIRVRAPGTGAAGIACIKMLTVMGVRRLNIATLDSKGMAHARRSDLSLRKAECACHTPIRST